VKTSILAGILSPCPRLATVIGLSAGILLGQETATRIGQHTIGESTQQWASLAGKRVPKDTSEITTRDSGWHGARSYEWRFIAGVLHQIIIRPYLQVLNYQEEISFLTQTYGEPTSSIKTPYHNAYGAQWERSTTIWHLSDGTLIQATEGSAFANPQRQLGSTFTAQGELLGIIFESKALQEWEERGRTKPNPYQ
jgi:hypothetical protein